MAGSSQQRFHYLSVAFICSSSEKSSHLRRMRHGITYTLAHTNAQLKIQIDVEPKRERECDKNSNRFYDKIQ